MIRSSYVVDFGQVFGVDVKTVRLREFRIVREMCEFLNGCPLGDGLDDEPLEVVL